MAVIKPKTGTALPTTGDIVDKEMAVDLTAQKLYVRDGGVIKEIGGGGGGLTVDRKTTTYTAEANDHVFADTSSAAWTLTLPATPAANDMVAITDYEETFSGNNLTVARNGSTIEGAAADTVLSTSSGSWWFVYQESTWRIFYFRTLRNVTGNVYLQGPTTGSEGTDVQLVITGWSATSTYSVAVGGGTYQRTTDLITWTLPSVTSDTSYTLTLTADGTDYTHDVLVLNVSTVTDTSIVVTNFALNDGNTGWTIS